jgi:hypothetical protein
MLSYIHLFFLIAITSAQYDPPPDPVLLTATKSGVLPVLPPAFTGVETLQGSIINKAPVNKSYTPVNGPAEVQSNLPTAAYTAFLPTTAFNELTNTTIFGTITGSSTEGDTGVTWTITLSNLPNLTEYGPFSYHIHDVPLPNVPRLASCTSTLGHFDYTNAGEYYTCDTSNPQNCQIGDLAGKHGKITSAPTFSATYVDDYLSTDPATPYFFGNRSIVFHSMNTTRLTCANFMMTGDGNGTSGGPGPVPTFSPNAGSRSVAGGMVAVAAGAFAWMIL